MKIHVILSAAALLAGCSDDAPNVPNDLKFASGQIQHEIKQGAGHRLACSPAMVEDRQAVHCRNPDSARWQGPAFEVVANLDSKFGIDAIPINGKAMQYSERFTDLSVKQYIAGKNLDYSVVQAAFEQAYPVN